MSSPLSSASQPGGAQEPPRTPLSRAAAWLVRVDAQASLVPIALVQGYRLFFSPWVGSACRFQPTCSAYALEALRLHGVARGSWLSARRLLRCHPGCAGGFDPVPRRGAPAPSRLSLEESKS